MQKFSVAAVQMEVALGEGDQNLKRASQFIREAAQAGAQVVCLPELFNTGYDYPYITQHADTLFAEGIKQLTQLAREAGIYLIAGSMAERVDGRVYNTCPVIGPAGDVRGRYRKIHLFPPLDEPKYFTPGEDYQVVNTPLGTWGVMLCYDLRFAELSIGLGLKGAEVIFVPAQFPKPRLHHWRILLQARALENQLYMVGINRCGSDPQHSYFGHSAVVDPQGKFIASLGQEEGILLATIDLGQNRLARKEVYYLGDKRGNLCYYNK